MQNVENTDLVSSVHRIALVEVTPRQVNSSTKNASMNESDPAILHRFGVFMEQMISFPSYRPS